MGFETVNDIEEALRSDRLTVRDLHTAFEQRQPVREGASKPAGAEAVSTLQIPWLQSTPSSAAEFTARALQKEEFLLVCDVAREALQHWTALRRPTTELIR